MDSFIKVKTLIGETNFTKLVNSKIVIIGLGGVGCSVFEALVRSGLKTITIFDYDKVDISNMNRQNLYNLNDISKLKVNVAEEKVLNINKNITINKYCVKISKDNINLIDFDSDYIIDACDDVDAKIEIIKYAIKNDIKLISCMGTANKFDPTRLEIISIWDTKYDKLSKIIRKKLKQEGISNDITVVASSEKQLTSSVLGSIYTVTNYAGILCAHYIINDIIK